MASRVLHTGSTLENQLDRLSLAQHDSPNDSTSNRKQQTASAKVSQLRARPPISIDFPLTLSVPPAALFPARPDSEFDFIQHPRSSSLSQARNRDELDYARVEVSRRTVCVLCDASPAFVRRVFLFCLVDLWITCARPFHKACPGCGAERQRYRYLRWRI